MGNEVTLDEKNLQSHLVKILQPGKQTVNGTGFICHPDGYVLTCYHVIEPYIQANRTGVAVNYQDESLQAQICKEHCIEEADIAVVKLVEQEKTWPYIELDVHKRWNLGDDVHSFGYPQDSSFRKTGIGITAKLASATKDERTEVVQIIGDTLENIAPGFSGAPVLHARTKKVIGLINSKYESKQAFSVPLDTLYRQWPELRDFHDVFDKIRSRLADEAQEKLNEKIKDTPFIPLRLECGRIPEKPAKEEAEKQKEKEWPHGRKWEDFDLENLIPISKPFILNSSVGTGKTTFLYWLVTKIVEKTDIVPVFMTCSDFERISPNKWDDLERQLVSNYERNFLKADIEDFFDTYHENKKLAFLFDGLDQIGSKEYSTIAERIFEICSPDSVLISSRPSAVISLETNAEKHFLRLKPFSLEEQEQYFGNYFDKASKLSSFAPDLVHIPMLAYMVRILIVDKKTEGVSTRTELYRRFIDYTIYKHEPHIPISSDKIQLTYDVKKTLKNLSFMALNLKEPQIQKVSMSLYSKANFKIDVDKLTTFGLVNLIAEKGDITSHPLFFTHQSFQEFLAAKYIHEHEKLIPEVLDEMWNPKWKEVIKFLAGLRGQEIIEKTLEKDNVIHAALFLAAECVPESKEINKELKEAIREEVRNLVNIEVFMKPAIYSLKLLEDIEQLALLIKDEHYEKREEALRTLVDIKESVDNMTLRVIVDRWQDKDRLMRRTAINALIALKDRISEKDIQKIAGRLQDENTYVREGAIAALVALKDKISEQDIQKIVNRLQDKNEVVRAVAIQALAELKDRITEQDISKITGLLQDKNHNIRKEAIKALVKFKDRITEQDIQKITGRLQDINYNIRKEAIKALVKFKDRITEQDIQKITGRLQDENEWVRIPAIKALVKFKDRITEQDIQKIADRLQDENKYVREYTIEALVVLKDKISEQDISKIIDRLQDENKYVREYTIKALVVLKDKISEQDISKIVDRLQDKNEVVRAVAINALVKLADRITEQDISKIVGRLQDKNFDVRGEANNALVKLADRITEQDIQKIADGLQGEYVFMRVAAIEALIVLKDRISEQDIQKIVERLEDDFWSPRRETVRALVAFKDRISEQDISKIIDRLQDHGLFMLVTAIENLTELKDWITDQNIQKIVGRLLDEDVFMQVAIRALIVLKDRISEQDIQKVAGRLQDKNKYVREDTIKALAELKDRITEQDIQKIAGRLQDKNEVVRAAAIKALAVFKDRVDKKDISKIAKRLRDKDEYVRTCATDGLVAFKDRLDKKNIRKITKILTAWNTNYSRAAYYTLSKLYESGIPLP